MQKPWADYLMKISNGRVVVDYYPDGALATLKETFDALETGILDMGFFGDQMSTRQFPLMDLFTLPGLMPNMAVANAVLEELYKKYPEFSNQHGGNVVNSFNVVQGFGQLHTRKPVRTLADLKGMVIGAHDEKAADMFSQAGAGTTISPSGSETYLALQRGVLDGVFAAWGAVNVHKYYEVTEYHTLVGLAPITSSWSFNRDAWEKFTQQEQELLKEYRFAARARVMQVIIESTRKLTMEEIPKENVFVLSKADMDEMKKLFKPMWEKWVEDMEELGYPARDMLDDALRYADYYAHN